MHWHRLQKNKIDKKLFCKSLKKNYLLHKIFPRLLLTLLLIPFCTTKPYSTSLNACTPGLFSIIMNHENVSEFNSLLTAR